MRFDAYALLRDEKAADTDGGTFTSGAWQTRDLNTESADADGIVSLSSNQFTLAAGTYFIRWRAPAYAVGFHATRLRNVTDGSTVDQGSSAYTDGGGAASQADSHGAARVTIAGTKAFEIQHRCLSTKSTDGFGAAGGTFGENEVYAEVEIWREAAGDSKISDLSAVTTLDGTEEFVLADSGATKKIAADDLAAALGGGLFTAYALLRDEKASGTNGGSLTSGAWRTRTLNTEYDPDGIVTLSSNQFTLAAGEYLIKARAPSYLGGNHQTRIRDITNTATVLVGSSSRTYSSDETQNDSIVTGLLTVTGTTTYELQHRVGAGDGTFGGGVANSFGEVEVYSEVEIWRKA